MKHGTDDANSDWILMELEAVVNAPPARHRKGLAMSHHYSDDMIEGFSLGRLKGPQLVEFEEHLLQCEECQDAVSITDRFVITVRGAMKFLRQHEGLAPGFPLSAKSEVEYLLVQANLPDATSQNIGILLVDVASDRLNYRFRRDFDKFAGPALIQLKQLADGIGGKANEIGAKKCVEWLESTFSSILRISERKVIPSEDNSATTVDRLYAKFIRAEVIPFRTHLPLYSLAAAAGKFGEQTDVKPEGWVEVFTDIPLTEEMFVTHVEGHSMEPLIPNASLCVFRANPGGAWDRKVLLFEHYGETGGNRYTVKMCQASHTADPLREDDEAWLHPLVTLESINPDYEPWDVASAEKIRALGEFLFVVKGEARISTALS